MALNQPPAPKVPVLNGSMFSQVWYRWFLSAKEEIENIVSGGEVNTASNIGAGEGVFSSKSGVDLRFKSLTAGSNVSLVSSGTEIEITGLSSNVVARATSSSTINSSAGQWNGNTDSGSITLTLPAGVQGERYKLVNTGTSGNTLTIMPDALENLLGFNSGFSLSDGEALDITYDSTDGWY